MTNEQERREKGSQREKELKQEQNTYRALVKGEYIYVCL